MNTTWLTYNSSAMFWPGAILLLVAASLAPVQLTPAQDRKDDIVKKADNFFGEHYQLLSGEKLRSFETRWRVDNEIFYRYGASHVVMLVFATDGSLARLDLFPEELLYRDSWSGKALSTLNLTPLQMEWLIETATKLQPLGQPIFKTTPPFLCFQSGANHYCSDGYEHASVGHYWREINTGKKEGYKTSLKTITIVYKK